MFEALDPQFPEDTVIRAFDREEERWMEEYAEELDEAAQKTVESEQSAS